MSARIWFVLADLASAQALTDRIGVFCRLCDRTCSWEWSPVYESIVGPTRYVVPCDGTVRDRIWSVEATAENNPVGIVANVGSPLFSAGELALLAEVDLADFTEHTKEE